jgi:hypothetical protein
MAEAAKTAGLKTVGIAGGFLTGVQFAASFTKALVQEVRYNEVSPDEYRRFGYPGAGEMGNMFQFKRDFEKEYCRSLFLRSDLHVRR